MIKQLEQYIERGYVCIPVVPGDKKAAIKWREAAASETAWEDQHEWFKNKPKNINVAILTGRVSGLFAVDLDPDKMVVDVEDFKAEFLAKSPTDFITRTPRGGYHLWYKVPDGVSLRNTVSFLAQGVDTRGDGGYALMPPSKVWYDALGERAYELISFGEAGTLSDEIIKQLTERSVRPDLPEAEAEDEELARILDGQFSPGKHNDELFWAARQLARRGLPESTIMDILLRANNLDETPQLEEEAARTIDNGMVSGYASKRPPDVEMPGNIAELAAMTLAKSAEKAADSVIDKLQTTKPVKDDGLKKGERISAAYELTDYTEFSLMYEAEEKYLIADWVPLGSVTLMVAPAGGGKTWLLMDMAIAVQLGNGIMGDDGFMGQYKSHYREPKNVLFIQQEDQPGKITMRMDAIYSVHADRLPEDERLRPRIENGWFIDDSLKHRSETSIFLLPNHTIRFDSDKEKTFTRLYHTIMKYEIDFVVFDPLYTLGDNSNYFAEFSDYILTLKQMREKIAQERGRTVTMIIAHHMNKAGAQEKTGRMSMYGSALLDAASDGVTIINNRDKEDGMIVMDVQAGGKAFMKDINREVRLDICTTEMSWRFEAIETEKDGSLEINDSEQMVYDLFLGMGETTVNEAAKQLDMSKRTVERAVAKLKGMGIVKPAGKRQRSTLYRLVEDKDEPAVLF